MSTSEVSKRSTFMYFGYGSNLLAKRLLIQNPSAIRKGSGVLKGYRLDFYSAGVESQSPTWNGSAATMVEDESANVWGAIWEIDLTHMADLDRQEGVLSNMYIPLIKDIETPSGEKIECRVYQMVVQPEDKVDLTDASRPDERKPSQTYIKTIVNGAIESQLPEEYITYLQSITDNGKLATPEMLAKLAD